MSSLTLHFNPQQCQLKSWQGHTTGCSSMLQNSVDVNHYADYLDKALSAEKRDSNVLAAECERSLNDLKNVEKSVAEDDLAHDYLIDASETNVVMKRAAVEAANAAVEAAKVRDMAT